MTLDYKLIGKRIKKCRERCKLTQEQLAEQVNISNQHMSNIERAVSIPSTQVIMRLAIALNTTPDEFLVGTVRHGDEQWRDVAQQLRPLTPGQLALVERFIAWAGEQEL